jgi:ABC-type transporter Mla maintaining outer membrane lipid asymmetry ATPase subunit MlaF
MIEMQDGFFDPRTCRYAGRAFRRHGAALAVALDPMLVMYDEPFTGLDPISLGVIGQLIHKLKHES